MFSDEENKFSYIDEAGMKTGQLFLNLFLEREKYAYYYVDEEDRYNISTKMVEMLEYLIPLVEKYPNNRKLYLSLQWSLVNLINKSKSKHRPAPQMFYFNIMKVLFPQLDILTNVLIENQPQIQESQYPILIKLIQTIYTKLPGLYTAIKQSMDDLLSKLPPNLLVQNYSIDLFDMKETISSSILGAIPLIDLTNRATLSQFLNHLVRFKDQNICKTMQSFILYKDKQYPEASQLFGNDNYITLANRSIFRNDHFIDKIFSECQRKMISKDDLKIVYSHTSTVQSLRPLIVLSVFDVLKENMSYFLSLVTKFKSEAKMYSLEMDMFNRFLNDSKIELFLFQLTGAHYMQSDFLIYSIPYIIKDNLVQQVDIELYSHAGRRPYFIISDKVRINDFSFIYAFKALEGALYMVLEGTDSPIASFIEVIDDTDIQTAVINDIFSLIFLQKDDGSYFCDVDKADRILLNLLNFIQDSTFFNSASDKLMFSRIQNAGLQSIPLGKALISPQSVIIEVIQTHEFDPALHLTKNNFKLMRIVRLIRAMQDKLSHSNSSDDDVSDLPIFNLEYYLSQSILLSPIKNFDFDNCSKKTVDDKPKISSVPVPSFSQPFVVGKAPKRRRKRMCHSMAENLEIEYQNRKLDPYPLDITLGNQIRDLISQAERTEYKITTTSIHSFPFFMSFLNYLELYRKLTGSFEVLNVQPRVVDVVRMIVKNTTLSSAQLESLLGPSALDLILQYSSIEDIKMQLFDFIYEKSKPTALAIFYNKIVERQCDIDSLQQAFSKIGNARGRRTSFSSLRLDGSMIDLHETITELAHFDKQDVFNRLLFKELAQMTNGDIEDVENINESLKDFSNEEYEKMISSALNSAMLPYQYLNNLYLRSPEIYMKNLLLKLPVFPPDVLLKLEPYIDNIALEHLKKLGLVSTDPTRVIPILLERQDFKYVQHFMIDFHAYELGVKLISNYILLNVRSFMAKAEPFLTSIENDLSAEAQKLIQTERKRIEKRKKEDLANLKRRRMTNDDAFYKAKSKHNNFIHQLHSVYYEYAKQYSFSQKMLQWIHTESLKFFNDVRIESSAYEFQFSGHVRGLSRLHQKINNVLLIDGIENPNETLLKQMEFIDTFIHMDICTKYSYPYNIKSIQSKNTGLMLASIARQFDYKQLMFEASAIWSQDLAQIVIPLTTACFYIGGHEEGLRVLQPLKQSKLEPSCDALIDQMIDSLMHPYPIDIEYVNEETQEITSLYEVAQDTIHNMGRPENSIRPISTMTSALQLLNESWRLIMLHSSFGRFEEAFEVWRKCDNKQSLFIRCIVGTSLTHSSWNTFWSQMSKQQKEFASYIEYFLNYLRSNKMFIIMYDIYQNRMMDYDNAIEVSIEGFIIAQSFPDRLRLVDKISAAVEQTIHQYQNHVQVEHKYTHKQLVNMRGKLDLQKKFIVYCINNQIHYSPDLEIITYQIQNQMKVALLMMRMNQCEFVLDLMTLVNVPELSFQKVCQQLLIDLQNSGDGSVTRFFKTIAKIDPLVYNVVIIPLIEAVAERIADKKTLMKFIKDNVISESAKAKLFLKFEFYEDAFNSAKITKDKVLLNEVLEQVSAVGNVSLMNKCKKALR